MKRQCHCSGSCAPSSDTFSRREFIELVGAGAATALLLPKAHAAEKELDLAGWKRALFEPSTPRVYRSGVHQDARLHLGGIGTGNFEIGADGQLTTWQLFNTLRDGEVPFYFAVKAEGMARLLQTTGGPDWPRVQRIEMTGEYPLARLRFLDPDLPVQLELTAFSPFAPLDTRLSSVPLAAFVFRLHNPTAQSQTVSLAAFLQNPVGYDALGRIEGNRHVDLGNNRNEPFETEAAQGLLLRAEPGQAATLDRPVYLFTTPAMTRVNTPPSDRPDHLHVAILDRDLPDPAKLADPAHSVIWIEEAAVDLSEKMLDFARKAVQAGATLVFSGTTFPLLQDYAQATQGKPLKLEPSQPDILFEDFEGGYERWKVEGTAFGARPATGTLPNQQRVSGFLGRGLVNSFLQGDDTTGRLTSAVFKLERNYLRFLVGGGSHSGTQVRLVVDGKVVRAVAGHDQERLQPTSWDVREYRGQSAHLEIVDEQQGAWGHINVDQIVLSDQPANLAILAWLEELLPARFSKLRLSKTQDGLPLNSVTFDDLLLKPGATERTASAGLRLLTHALGQGQVMVASGSILEPRLAESVNARQRAYQLLCELVGARYVKPSGPLPTAPGFGELALVALDRHATVLPGFADWPTAWTAFSSQGHFTPLADAAASSPTGPGQTVNGAVASTVQLAAGGTTEMAFLLAWRYPNKYNADGSWMGCHYATEWPDARGVIREASRQWPSWREKTERFHRAMYDTSLPYWLTDCLTSQSAIIRHIGVVFRIANGDVYGWEGSNGCCQPTCTHVWGYEQTLSRLFPGLEREMRRIDFHHQQRPDGGVNNRTEVPSPRHPTGEQPFADGHASCVLKAYREALNQENDAWLREYWPPVKRAVDYLIDRDRRTSGGQASGVLQDDQWNTYDEALHGVTTFIGTYYLAALRAGEEWAKRLGDIATAERFHRVFEAGQQRLIELCWNGEYFQQHLPDYLKRAGEVGPGCMSDQLIGQWWAHQLGLGYLLPPDKVQSSLRAIFKYNWKSDLTGWKHLPRAFAGNGDKGLIICTWPKGGRPDQVMLYSDEVWTGIEYQVAAHMIYEGLIEEGLALVKSARDRYDGVARPPILRNPWNEIECGGHYARALSSWSLLLALSGYAYDGPAKSLQFKPRLVPARFRAFFAAPEGWGRLSQTREQGLQRNEITVAEGRLALAEIRLEVPSTPRDVRVTLATASTAITFRPEPAGVVVRLSVPAVLRTGETLALDCLFG